LGWWAFQWWDNTLWAVSDAKWSPHTDCPAKQFFGPGDLANYCHATHFWSWHPVGGNWLLGDGSVRFMAYDSGLEIVPQMASISGEAKTPDVFP
jgi:hypothetical protein